MHGHDQESCPTVHGSKTAPGAPSPRGSRCGSTSAAGSSCSTGTCAPRVVRAARGRQALAAGRHREPRSGGGRRARGRAAPLPAPGRSPGGGRFSGQPPRVVARAAGDGALRALGQGAGHRAAQPPARRGRLLQKEAAPTEDERLEIVVHRRVTDETPLRLTTRVTSTWPARSARCCSAGRCRRVSCRWRSTARCRRASSPTPGCACRCAPGPSRSPSRRGARGRSRSSGARSRIRRRPVRRRARPPSAGRGASARNLGLRGAARAPARLGGGGGRGGSAADLAPGRLEAAAGLPDGVGDTMRLVEKRRGDAEPAAERLTLARTLWLDFGGRGFTVSDTITGALRRAARLEMTPPLKLGRVSLAVATSSSPPRRPGADRGRAATGPARAHGRQPTRDRTGADPRRRLGPRLPPGLGHAQPAPGWRLLHAGGVDEVRGRGCATGRCWRSSSPWCSPSACGGSAACSGAGSRS